MRGGRCACLVAAGGGAAGGATRGGDGMSVRLDGTETFVDAGTVRARHTTLPPECAVGMGEANGDGRLVDRGRHVATCDGPTGFVMV